MDGGKNCKMEQSTLTNFFPVKKHTSTDLGRKRKREDHAKKTAASSFSVIRSDAQAETVGQREKKVGTRLIPPTTRSSPLQAGSRGMAMLRQAQQKNKTPGRSKSPPASDSKPVPQSSGKSDSPRLQRFKSVEFVSPKKRCVLCY